MDATYFLTKLRFWEIKAYLDGMDRRKRPVWEAARELAWWSLKAMGAKDLPGDMSKFRPLPWDAVAPPVESHEVSDEEVEKALRLIEEENKKNRFSL